jgi:hypothetical protein
MPSLSIQFNPKVGPLLNVFIWKPGYAPPPAAQGANAAAPLNVNAYAALIDTGASCSCVSDKVIKTEGLVPYGKQQVGGVHGAQSTNAYRFQLVIPFVQGQNVTGSVNANVIVFNISGVEFIPLPGIDALIGRDILCTGVFHMSFDGHATLSLG